MGGEFGFLNWNISVRAVENGWIVSQHGSDWVAKSEAEVLKLVKGCLSAQRDVEQE